MWNIATRWVSMINFVKHVLFKYYIFGVKIALDALAIPSVKSNLSLLIDVENLLGLNLMMLMSKVIHS
jgi:hypothetical protein